jgi:hypothetical protein
VSISATVELFDLLCQKGPDRLPEEIEFLNEAIHLHLSSCGLFLISFYTMSRGKRKAHKKKWKIDSKAALGYLKSFAGMILHPG